MTEAERLAIKQKLKDDFPHYASKCLFIRSKEGAVKPFILNRGQLYLHECIENQKKETGMVRVLILKARQLGCSTYVGGRFYHQTTHRIGCKAFIMAHEKDATDNLYDMTKRYYEHTPQPVKPEISKSNAKELVFGRLDSSYKLGTAENKKVGRSATIQLLHGSEVAFWNHADEHAKGLLQAVPSMPGTEIILESTANGVGNFFHQEWQKAEAGISDFIPVFIPWFWQSEYSATAPIDFSPTPEEQELVEYYGLTNNQLYWRRKKISELSVNGVDGEKSFRQEYPCIAGGQRVGTNRGIIPIEEVVYKDDISYGQVTRKWDKGVKETILVETELGYTLACTPEHKIKSENDFIEAAQSLGQSIVLSSPRFAHHGCNISWNYMPSTMASTYINEDMGLFLGFFMGDGSYYDDTLSFAFNVIDQDCINLIQQLVFKLFGVNMSYRTTSKNGAELRVSCKKFRELFASLGIINITSYATKRKVCVPECIWRSPENVVAKFISGVFETDGFANYRHAAVKLFSKHDQFIKDIQLLLLGFGITSKRIHVEKINGQGFKYMGNELSLRSSEARMFAEKIGFISQRKIKRQEMWLLPFNYGRTAAPVELKDKVKSITNNGFMEVYDLEIEQNHVFDANGFLVHNCTAAEAFILSGEDGYILPNVVMRARKNKEAQPYGALVIGVDPARFGDDRTAIIRRRGRCAYNLQTFIKKDTMEIAGIVHTIYKNENPAKIYVDVGGLGAGVVDRLNELIGGDIVESVNAGSKPLDADRYRNKRSEMWATLKEWFDDEPCSIPDSDELQSDLCNIKYQIDSNSRLVMESKDHMKSRGIRSCDTADALCLTFANPNPNLDIQLSKQRDNILQSMAEDFTKKFSAINRSRGQK